MAKALPESVQAPLPASQLSPYELQQIFDLAPFGIGVFDREFRCRGVNPTLAEFNGLPQMEHVGKCLREIVPALAPELEPLFQQILDNRIPRVEISLSGPTAASPGTLRHWLAVYSPMLDAQGKPDGILTIVRDVTAQFEAQQRLQLAMKAGQISVWEWHIDEDRLLFEGQLEPLLGVQSGQFQGGIQSFIDRFAPDSAERLRSALGETSPIQLTLSYFDQDQHPGWIDLHADHVAATRHQGRRIMGVIHEATARRSQEERLCRAEGRLHHLAYHDPLTGLGNRNMLQERLELEIMTASLNQHGFALLFIDLDGFKLINDNLGHRAGDLLLNLLAERIRRGLRPQDLATRLGGDEFLVLIPCLGRCQALTELVETLLGRLHEPAELGQEQVTISASIGIALYPDHGQTPDSLISAADSAMHEAKRQGRNGHLFYSPAMAEQMREQMALEQGLIRAMEQQQFCLLYQPMTDLASDRLSGLEALLRWQHPSEGMIPPARFIPVAEQSGLIERLGEWVMRTACQQGCQWLAEGLAVPRLSVNVSVREMRSTGYVERVAAILAETGFPADRLEIEVTESIIQSVDQSLRLFTRLKALGVQIAIDDFGTGFSSLSLLKSLPIDRIKIDRTFVQALPDDKHSRELCRAIVHLADSLGMAVTAEGIETQSQRRFLQSLRCEEGQGYLFSHPLSRPHLDALLEPQT